MNTLQEGAANLGITLSDARLHKFDVYYQELMQWNEKFNLTAIVDREAVYVKHFLDSLTITEELQHGDSKTVIDIGSGGGLPGIPLAIVLPECSITLLEATGKKAVFLRHIIETLGLENVHVVHGRAEEYAHMPDYRENFGFVLARAVAPLNVLVELLLPFCTVGGTCIAPKKGDIEGEIAAALSGIERLGGTIRAIKTVSIPDEENDRRLVIIEKIRATPEMYPRRPGIPSKRPLV